MRITSSVEEEAGVSRTGCLRGGDGEGDEACPAVDHRDLGVDMETTAEWPPAGTGSLRTAVVFYTFCSSVRTHKHIRVDPARHRNPILECMRMFVRKCRRIFLCLFPKQIQMYVVVGLRFQCHGLYCLSLCGG